MMHQESVNNSSSLFLEMLLRKIISVRVWVLKMKTNSQIFSEAWRPLVLLKIAFLLGIEIPNHPKIIRNEKDRETRHLIPWLGIIVAQFSASDFLVITLRIISLETRIKIDLMRTEVSITAELGRTWLEAKGAASLIKTMKKKLQFLATVGVHPSLAKISSRITTRITAQEKHNQASLKTVEAKTMMSSSQECSGITMAAHSVI
jgi:hypothetical protein